jgi:iron complex transport system ATP-binding protein
LSGRDLKTLSRAEIARAVALDRMGIGHLAMRPVTELSGGQRQMALIARAPAVGHAAPALHEPAGSLDWGNRHRLMDRRDNLAADGLGLILSTHEPDHAARVASRVLTIDAEGTSWTGPAAQALQRGVSRASMAGR